MGAKPRHHVHASAEPSLRFDPQVLAVQLAPSVWQEAPYLPQGLRCRCLTLRAASCLA